MNLKVLVHKMKRRYAIIFLIFAVNISIYGDRILLNNGQFIKGRIREKTDLRVTIENPTGSFSLYLKDVKKIEEDSPVRNSLIDAGIFLAKKDAQNALDAYQKALSQGLDFSQFTQHFLNQFSKWEACFEEESDYQKDVIGKNIIRIMEDAGMDSSTDFLTTDTLEFYFAGAKVLAKTGHGQKAMEIFSSLPNRFYEAFPEKRILAVKFLKSETVKRMNQGEFDEAILALENLQNLDRGEERKSRILVFLRWGARLRDQRQWKDAALIYSIRIAPLSREIAANRLNYLLEIMEREATNESDYMEIIQLSREYSSLISELPESAPEAKKLEKLYHKAGEVALDNDHTTQALSLFREGFLASNKKNMALFDLYQYTQTLTTLAPDDFIGHYELGGFCRKKGLFDKAERRFRYSFSDSRLKPSAEREIDLMKKHRHVDTLKNAVQFYDAKDYTRALDILQPLFNDKPTTDVLKELVRLDELCRGQLENESNKRPIRALIQYQQAERLFLLEEYDDALDRINYLLETYPDTPIAPKARDLMITVLRRRELARLENPDKTDRARGNFTKVSIKDRSRINEEINKLVESLNDE